MMDMLSRWNPGEVIGLTAVVGAAAVFLVATIAGAWSRVRRSEIAAELKRDLLQRGLTVEQIERLVAGPSDDEPVNEKELEAQLASLLVQNEVPSATLEEVLHLYQGTDGTTKKAVYDSLEEILGSEPTEEQLLAAVRALCPPRKGQCAPRVEDSCLRS